MSEAKVERCHHCKFLTYPRTSTPEFLVDEEGDYFLANEGDASAYLLEGLEHYINEKAGTDGFNLKEWKTWIGDFYINSTKVYMEVPVESVLEGHEDDIKRVVADMVRATEDPDLSTYRLLYAKFEGINPSEIE